MDSSSRRMLPELNLTKLYSHHNRENVRFTTGGPGLVPKPSSSYRGRRFISSTRHGAQAMLRPALYTGMHSTFWDTLASTRRMSKGSNDGGPAPVPLSERTHERTRGSNKALGHTLGSVTERANKNNAESMVPSLPALGPREGGVLITALDAKAMKLHPPSSRRHRGDMRRHYSRRPSNGSNNVPGVNINPSATNIVIPTVVDSAGRASARKSESRAQHTSAARLGSRQGDRTSALTPVPLTPADILSIKGHTLTAFEVGEITGYPHIYYVGQRRGHSSAQQPPIVGQEGPEPLPNDGFDDARGDYHVVKHDHVAYRYEILGSLGKGSFGQVWRCLDHQTSTHVALKIVRNKKRFRAQGEIEVKILQHVRDHDPDDEKNVIHFIESFYFRNHLCIALPLMSLNLYDYLKERHFRGLSLVEINYVARQLLACLSFLKQQNIVHCDLKPENVLLREEARLAVVLIDFGSSCFKDHTLYTYIQSRFYRSPEVLLGLPYGQPIDMWSVGCILAELYTGVPLFPGENEVDQMSCITEVMGPLPPTMVRDAPKRKRYFADDGSPIAPQNSKNVTRRVGSLSLGAALRCEDAGFVSFLASTLALEPRERADADTAAAHEWMTLHPHRPQSKAARSRLGSPSLRASLRRHLYDLNQTQSLAPNGPHSGPPYAAQPPPVTAPTSGPLNPNPSAGGLKADAQLQRKIRNSLQTLGVQESLPLSTVTEGVVAAPPLLPTRESSVHPLGTHHRRPSHPRESHQDPPPDSGPPYPHAPPARPSGHASNGQQQPFHHHHYHHRQRSSGHMPHVAPPPM